MKKKRYFIQVCLKNGDTYCMYSYSKKKVLSSFKSLFSLFDGQISLTTSNFELK